MIVDTHAHLVIPISIVYIPQSVLCLALNSCRLSVSNELSRKVQVIPVALVGLLGTL